MPVVCSTLPDGTVVMGSEPIPGWEPEDIQKWYAEHHSEVGLAHAFAAASNKFWWLEGNIYDLEEGTSEHQEACRITDSWGDLMNTLQDEIFVILKRECVIIPEKGQIAVLIPFMDRNGYYNGNGWWLPKEDKDCTG